MKNLLIVANIRKSQGGITTQILELANSLKFEGFTIEIISTHGTLKERIISIVRVLNRCSHFDLIIAAGCSYYGFFPIMVASLASMMRKKKIIYNFHDGQVEDFLKRYNGLIRLFIGNNLIIVATEFLKKAFIKYGFNALKIHNHFNSIPTFNSFNKKDNVIKILWARSFENLYDPYTAIKAANHFKSNPKIHFHFYGTGNQFEYFKENFTQSNVLFFGNINRNELLGKYCDYDIFLNTTLFDNFPMSIVEAGMNKLIVISSEAGAIPELYNENEVIFFKTGDPDNLIKKLSFVIQNLEKYRIFGERLYSRVKHFTWQKVKEDWIGIINNMIKQD